MTRAQPDASAQVRTPRSEWSSPAEGLNCCCRSMFILSSSREISRHPFSFISRNSLLSRDVTTTRLRNGSSESTRRLTKPPGEALGRPCPEAIQNPRRSPFAHHHGDALFYSNEHSSPTFLVYDSRAACMHRSTPRRAPAVARLPEATVRRKRPAKMASLPERGVRAKMAPPSFPSLPGPTCRHVGRALSLACSPARPPCETRPDGTPMAPAAGSLRELERKPPPPFLPHCVPDQVRVR